MDPVSVAVVGIGVIGAKHVRHLAASQDFDLVALCDVDEERVAGYASEYGTRQFTDYQSMLSLPGLEAVVVATHHYLHGPIARAAFDRGIHVLVEKPVGVHVGDVRGMVEAYEEARSSHPDLVFATMFQQRVYPQWRDMKAMIDEGSLGRLIRATWVITDWFRTQRYYDTGGWRATWRGEGGGVLLNQCPHQLDLYQWLFGMPRRLSGFAHFGKYHRIEVEDEVSAFMEHDTGMVGHFITSTAESPGTNRLEVVGEHAQLVYEGNAITIHWNQQSALQYLERSPETMTPVPWRTETRELPSFEKMTHGRLLDNFARAVREGEPLVAHGSEGLHSVELSNAILLSAIQGGMVDLPLDPSRMEALLGTLAEQAAGGPARGRHGLKYEIGM